MMALVGQRTEKSKRCRLIALTMCGIGILDEDPIFTLPRKSACFAQRRSPNSRSSIRNRLMKSR